MQRPSAVHSHILLDVRLGLLHGRPPSRARAIEQRTSANAFLWPGHAGLMVVIDEDPS